jgi:hypothetical protein
MTRYLTTTVHAWDGQPPCRVQLMIEPDGTVWADDSSRGGNWSEPEWTSCHSISEEDQDTIRAMAARHAAANPCLGSELGEIPWPVRRAS